MIPCTVQRHYGALLVTFPDGKTLLLQADYDQAAFCYNCGLIKTDDPSSDAFAQCDPTNIERCPSDYLDVASNATQWTVELPIVVTDAIYAAHAAALKLTGNRAHNLRIIWEDVEYSALIGGREYRPRLYYTYNHISHDEAIRKQPDGSVHVLDGLTGLCYYGNNTIDPPIIAPPPHK